MDLGKVFLLLDEVVLKTDIPPEWVSKLDQKPSVALSLDKICGLLRNYEKDRLSYIRVKLGPDFSEVVAKLCVHELVILFARLLERLKNDCNEESHENHHHKDHIGEEVS